MTSSRTDYVCRFWKEHVGIIVFDKYNWQRWYYFHGEVLLFIGILRVFAVTGIVVYENAVVLKLTKSPKLSMK